MQPFFSNNKMVKVTSKSTSEPKEKPYEQLVTITNSLKDYIENSIGKLRHKTSVLRRQEAEDVAGP